MFESYKLKNNATVILVPQKDTKSVTTLVMYPVGSRYETESLRGASHYVEHLMFKGTKKRENTLALTREIDRLGAEYNAFTGKEYTGYYIKTDATYTETSFDILSDMLFNSTFDPTEMEREKTVIVEEIRMYNDNPLMNIENIFEELMFEGSPLGLDIAGTEQHVRDYKRDDVIAYKDKHYQPQHMIIVVAGAITQKTEELLNTYFGEQQNTQEKEDAFLPASCGPTQKEKRISVQKKATDQVQMMLGYPGFKYKDVEKNAIATVMSTILGGSMSSRLFIQIRERRGLAYMVRRGMENFHDSGYAYIRIGLEAKNINDAIAVTKEEIQKIIDNGVTEEELKDAKTHLHGAITLSLEDSSTQANWYAHQAIFMDKLSTPEEKLERINTVTNEQIKQLAKEIFNNEQLRVAIIGNVEKNDIVF